MRVPMHGNLDIRRKLRNGNEGSGHGHRYGDNPEKDYEEFLQGHRVRLSLEDAAIIVWVDKAANPLKCSAALFLILERFFSQI